MMTLSTGKRGQNDGEEKKFNKINTADRYAPADFYVSPQNARSKQ